MTWRKPITLTYRRCRCEDVPYCRCRSWWRHGRSIRWLSSHPYTYPRELGSGIEPSSYCAGSDRAYHHGNGRLHFLASAHQSSLLITKIRMMWDSEERVMILWWMNWDHLIYYVRLWLLQQHTQWEHESIYSRIIRLLRWNSEQIWVEDSIRSSKYDQLICIMIS